MLCYIKIRFVIGQFKQCKLTISNLDLDTVLYRHFNRTLWRRIEKFGASRMKTEVAKLRDYNQKLTKECVVEQNVDVKELDIQFRDWIPPNITIRGNRLKENPPETWYVEFIFHKENFHNFLL